MVIKHQNNQNFVEMVIGNKKDLVNFREVSENEGRKWARSKNIELFYETSALQNINIEEALSKLAQKTISTFNESVHRPFKLVRKEGFHRGCC